MIQLHIKQPKYLPKIIIWAKNFFWKNVSPFGNKNSKFQKTVIHIKGFQFSKIPLPCCWAWKTWFLVFWLFWLRSCFGHFYKISWIKKLPTTQKEIFNEKSVFHVRQFLEEYLIYFKSELLLNSKLSHLPNSLIRSHSTFTRKWSGLSEMAICVKAFCFRPNWALHNKIMVAGYIYNIFQKHQNEKILDISNIEPPLEYWACRKWR